MRGRIPLQNNNNMRCPEGQHTKSKRRMEDIKETKNKRKGRRTPFPLLISVNPDDKEKLHFIRPTQYLLLDFQLFF